MSGFRGMILGIEYEDRKAFVKAARGAGYRSGLRGRTGDWRVGLAVNFRTADGISTIGQVWSKGKIKGTVVLALSNGRYARVVTDTFEGELIDSRGRDLGVRGRVTA